MSGHGWRKYAKDESGDDSSERYAEAFRNATVAQRMRKDWLSSLHVSAQSEGNTGNIARGRRIDLGVFEIELGLSQGRVGTLVEGLG